MPAMWTVPEGAMRLPERRRRSVVLPAPLAVIVSQDLHAHLALLHTSDQKCSTARRQVKEDIFQPTRAIREGIAEVLHVN